MKCKKHISDLSSVVGVCATCLREKLFVLIEAQSHLEQAQEQRRNSNANPPPRFVFTQSVSPYASRRESDTAACRLSRHGLTADQRFHATPQVGPTGDLISEYSKKKTKKKKKNSGFSLFYHIFRAKSSNLDSDSDPRVPNSDDQCNTMPSSSSPSWFSTILAGRRGKKTRSLSLDEATIGVRRRTVRNCDRGMSPARYSDEENEEDYQSGSSGQSSPAWKQTPRRTPAWRGGGKGGLSRNAFCLSPLVWASPNHRWSQKGMAPEMVYPGGGGGEINRSPAAKSRFHNATSFCKNRSRKLADIGRFRHNH